jgi:cysteine desulfuration protein SufE
LRGGGGGAPHITAAPEERRTAMDGPATSSVAEAAERLREDFALLEDHRDKVEHLIDLGKRLPPMPQDLKTEASKVRGCQSQVWLVGDALPDGRLRFLADSDAILVRGLIALLLELYDRRRPEEIVANPPAVLEEIGLQRFLTPGRANGLYAMVGRIRAMAEAARAPAGGVRGS